MENDPASTADAPEASEQPTADSRQRTADSGQRPTPEGEKEGTPEERLARAKEDAQKYLANWQRAEADFSNYKKRTEQERDELRRFGNVSLIINLLPVIDDFERAFSSLDSHLASLSWFDGIYLIYRKLQQLLENAGVKPIESEGQTFDPRYHEAVAHVEGEDGKVLSEVQRGYKLHDRVLRPAMVVVGKGKASEEDGSAKKEEGNEGDQPS
jgi:molecular chaperone GrpE